VAPVLVVMLACGGADSNENGAASSTTTPTAAVSSTTATSVASPASSAAPRPPATRGPKTITFGRITFHAPSNWDKASGGATTAFVGVLAGGKGDVNLRVMLDYTGTVDELQPQDCLGAESLTPASVELLESGFAPVGDLTAEYRRWRFSCPDSDLKVEEHGVWLLPISDIAIVEQRHAPEVIDVVTTADVA